MTALFDTFRDAPTLGSLIDPARSVSEDILTAGFEELRPLLEKALREHAGEEEWEETAIAAYGLADTARLLACTYHAVLTNVPYLGREKHIPRLRSFCETTYPLSKHDLATVFIERILRLCASGGEAILVLPQYWLFLARYRGLRHSLLENYNWHLLATLGPGAFETISGEVVNTCLISVSSALERAPHPAFSWIDATKGPNHESKDTLLRTETVFLLSQADQLTNPDSVIGYQADQDQPLLETCCVLLSRLSHQRQRAVRL